jgi:hypothetical protein
MKLPTLKPFPHTDSQDRVEILCVVCEAILDEPKRYDQGEWVLVVQSCYDDAPRERFPACGTIACVAGWTVIVTHEAGGDAELPAETEWVARQRLQLTAAQADVLFSGGALHKDGLLPDPPEDFSWCTLDYEGNEVYRYSAIDRAERYQNTLKGTTIYAAAGVRHIEAFMREEFGVELGVLAARGIAAAAQAAHGPVVAV